MKFRVDNRTATAMITLPVVEVPRVDGATLWSLLSSDGVLNVTITPDRKYYIAVNYYVVLTLRIQTKKILGL